jgi:hypothetical protein
MSTNHVLIIKSILTSSAAWRARVAQEFPGDARNAVAKGLLENLAADTMPEEIIGRIDHYSDSEVAREATTAAKLVGFRSFPNTLSSFANDVIDRIEISRAEWAQAFRRDGGAK